MKKILLFGAGKSATVLIEYLLQQCASRQWVFTVVDANYDLAAAKIGDNTAGQAASFDVTNSAERAKYIEAADIVISLLPPALHQLVANDCVAIGRNLLTASYIDAGIEALREKIEEKELLFLCEMGLDPGIDHMSAAKLLHQIDADGGTVRSFISHCGGLVAPESNDNPWHYKISWNPRNVVMAGKDGATFRENGQTVRWEYEKLFAEHRTAVVDGVPYCWYPNRDSLRYLPIYKLEGCDTFIRTTLRHPDFIFGWKNLIELGLTNTDYQYQTDGMTLQVFFKQHFERVDFDAWLSKKLAHNLAVQERLFEAYFNAAGTGTDADKESTSKQLQDHLTASGLVLDQLSWLGLKDAQTVIDRGLCTAADVLQFILEKKLALQPGDRDLVVMQHEIEYEKSGKKRKLKSSLVVTGKDDVHTAMAATVGLPLGIAALAVLEGKMNLTGLHIPVVPEIYEAVLAALAAAGISFKETVE